MSPARDLVALSPTFNPTEAVRRVTAAKDQVWAVIYCEVRFLLVTLTPGQVLLLPDSIRAMATTPDAGLQVLFFCGF